MTGAMSWFDAGMIEALGWTLMHFLWQAVLLAGLLYAVLPFFRTSSSRYAVALATLVLMTVSACATFSVLWSHPQAMDSLQQLIKGVRQAPIGFNAAVSSAAAAIKTGPISDVAGSRQAVTWLNAGVWLWFFGVLLFSIRAFGGWFVLTRVIRENAKPLSASLHARCIAVQRRLGLDPAIRYLESNVIDTPAVMGWLRPVLLLPVSSLVGLSAAQLEAVIAHELAHIRRFDLIVNLFQIAAESLFFYHPAVWFVSRLIRNEREHCCDDVAVKLCGDPHEYALALTLMEEWRHAPAIALAANGGALRARISRVLGLPALRSGVPLAGLAAVGTLLAGGVLFASTSFSVTIAPSANTWPNVVLYSSANARVAAHAAPLSRPALRDMKKVSESPEPALISSSEARAEGITATAVDQTVAQSTVAQTNDAAEAPSKNDESYIDSLRSLGLKDLKVSELVALKVHGVTPQYIRDIRSAGLNPGVNDLLALKVQGVDAGYIRDLRAAGFNPDLHQIIAFKVQGIDPNYIREMRATGLNLDLNHLIAMKVQGVDAAYVGKIQAAFGKSVPAGDIIAMKVQGVNVEDRDEYRALGLNDISMHQLIAMRIQGISPNYIRNLKAAGLTGLSANEYIRAKVQDITPEFIQKAHAHGFDNLKLNQLVALKQAGVL